MMKWGSNWSVKEQAMFLQLISQLLERGYPLNEAVLSLKYQFNKRLASDFDYCLEQLKNGFSFSHILTNLNFNDDLVGYVYFAERHGGFVKAIKDGSAITIQRRNDIEKLGKLLFYPTVLIVFTIIAFLIVEKLLLPRFLLLFSSLQIETNFFTNLLLAIAKFSPLLMFIILIIVISVGTYYLFFFKKKSQLLQRSLLIKIPLIGSLLKLFYTQFFSAQLSYLLRGGLSINEAIKIFENNYDQPFYEQLGVKIKAMLINGYKLEDVIRSFLFFEQDFANVLEHGQKNGRLDEELFFYSRYCLTKLEDRISKLIKVIQPIIYLIIGIMIVSMYLAILLPMFKVLDGF